MLKKIVNKINDNLNPILVKELRQATNGKSIFSLMVLFIVVMFIILVIQLMMNEYNMDAGQEMFEMLLIILSSTLLCVIPFQQANMFFSERSSKTMELLYSSTITPFKILLGKYLSINTLALQFYCLALPFMTISYLLRGIDVFNILLYCILLFLAMQPVLAFSIFAASLKISKVLFNLMMSAALVGYFALCSGLYSFLNYSQGLYSNKVLIILSAFTFLALQVIWFFIFLSVCVLSAPSSNRALPIRIYIGACFFLDITILIIINVFYPYMDIFENFAIGVSFVFFILGLAGMLIASNERYVYNYRLLYKIPKSIFKRMIVFPFFSGLVNGVLFSVIISFGSMLLFFITEVIHKHKFPVKYSDLEPFIVLLGAFEYTLFASIYAFFIKKNIFEKKFPKIPATAYALSLIFISIIIPFLIAIIVLGQKNFYEDSISVFFVGSFIGIIFKNVGYLSLIIDSFLALSATIFFIPQIKNAIKTFKPLCDKSDIVEINKSVDSNVSEVN